MRVGILTPVRLLGEAIALSLCARDERMQVEVTRDLEGLRTAARAEALDVAIVDTTQATDLDDVRSFHLDHPEVPLLALGLREREAEVVAHGSAGFVCYLRREDGLDRLCSIVEDAVEGRLHCSPEIAAAIMRGLFSTPPAPAAEPHAPLTPREQEVAGLVSHGLSNKEIARELELSESTVKHHVHAILGKIKVPTRLRLMRSMRPDLWAHQSHVRKSG
jgi:two-component system, NarL family, nitrate/nitrite response regulator NarL